MVFGGAGSVQWTVTVGKVRVGALLGATERLMNLVFGLCDELNLVFGLCDGHLLIPGGNLRSCVGTVQ